MVCDSFCKMVQLVLISITSREMKQHMYELYCLIETCSIVYDYTSIRFRKSDPRFRSFHCSSNVVLLYMVFLISKQIRYHGTITMNIEVLTFSLSDVISSSDRVSALPITGMRLTTSHRLFITHMSNGLRLGTNESDNICNLRFVVYQTILAFNCVLGNSEHFRLS